MIDMVLYRWELLDLSAVREDRCEALIAQAYDPSVYGVATSG